MKRNPWMTRTLTWILIFSLALACAPALAEDAQTTSFADVVLTIQRSFEVTLTETPVYHDGAFQQPWGTLPAGMVVPVERLSSGFVTVTMNGNVGYISPTATRALTNADQIYAREDTRVYQQPTTKSRYIEVPAGTEVQFVAMAGSVVQVTRDGKTGYMNANHLGVKLEADAPEV